MKKKFFHFFAFFYSPLFSLSLHKNIGNGNASIVLDHGVPILNLSHKSTNRVFTLLPGESVESLANSIQKEFGLEKAKVSFSTQQNGALLAGSSDVRLLSKLPVSLHLGESKLNVDVSKPGKVFLQKDQIKINYIHIKYKIEIYKNK